MLKTIIFFLLTSTAFAAVDIELDYSDFSAARPVHLKRHLRTEFDRVKVFPIPNSQQEVEILVSEKLPPEQAKKMALDEAALVTLTFYEVKDSGRQMISSGKVVTRWGKGALMKKFKDRAGKRPLMSLKVTPSKTY
jgi:hypothetical protein